MNLKRIAALVSPVVVATLFCQGWNAASAAPRPSTAPARNTTSTVPMYTVTDLGCAYAVNDLSNAGTVVGLAGGTINGQPSPGLHVPFQWDGGTFTYLKTYPWQGSAEAGACATSSVATPVSSFFGANALTSSDEVVGAGLPFAESDAFGYQATTWGGPAAAPTGHAVRCSDSGTPKAEQSSLIGVNDAGTAVGYKTPCGETPPNFTQKAVIDQPGGFRVIGSGSSAHEVAVAINSAGSQALVVGVPSGSDLPGAAVAGTAELWGSSGSKALGISAMDVTGGLNDSGVAVGAAGGKAAYSLDGGAPVVLPGLTSNGGGFADAVNNSGDIVGTSGGAATIWPVAAEPSLTTGDPEPDPINLNTAVPGGLNLTRAWFINDAGEIVASSAGGWVLLSPPCVRPQVLDAKARRDSTGAISVSLKYRAELGCYKPTVKLEPTAQAVRQPIDLQVEVLPSPNGAAYVDFLAQRSLAAADSCWVGGVARLTVEHGAATARGTRQVVTNVATLDPAIPAATAHARRTQTAVKVAATVTHLPPPVCGRATIEIDGRAVAHFTQIGATATARATRGVCTTAARIVAKIPPADGTATARRRVNVTGVPISRIKKCHAP